MDLFSSSFVESKEDFSKVDKIAFVIIIIYETGFVKITDT